MALCGGLCMTENSSTPRQGNAEDRADYSSFSALTEGLHRCCFRDWKYPFVTCGIGVAFICSQKVIQAYTRM